MNAQRPRPSRPGPCDPSPDLRTLLAQRGLTVTHVERVAGMARGSLQRILAGRRGGDSLYTVEKVARVLDLPLATIVAAMGVSIAAAQERRRRALGCERVRLEAQSRPGSGSSRRP